MKGILAYILRSTEPDLLRWGDSSNGGISSRCHQVILVSGDMAVEGPFEPNERTPAVALYSHGAHCIAVPVNRPNGMVGPMFGGCYIATSDSRFREAVGIYGAIPLHDRFETQEQYDSLSV